MKKHLLIVLQNFGMGGAQNMVYELLRCLDRDSFYVDVLCYGKKLDNSLTKKVEQIQNVKYLGLDGSIGLKAIFKVISEINKINPDVVHAHLGGVQFAVVWGTIYHKKVIVTAHTKPERAFSSKILPLLRKNLKKDRLKLIAVSKVNQQLLANFFDLKPERIPFINNGINVDRYYRKEHDQFTFINVGRQDENKNQIAILDAFEKLQPADNKLKLLLVGDGDKHSYLVDEVQRRELSNFVTLPGNVGNTEDYYAVSDCYVQSSHREALPLTALEAMAAGLPIISTDVGGMKDIVKKNGYLIPDNEGDCLYEAMRKIVELDTADRTDLEKEAEIMIRDYTAEEMTQRYAEQYGVVS